MRKNPIPLPIPESISGILYDIKYILKLECLKCPFNHLQDEQTESEVWKVPSPVPKQFPLLEGQDERRLCERRLILQELTASVLPLLALFPMQAGDLIPTCAPLLLKTRGRQ